VWIHVPSTSSAFAPEGPASISDSSSLAAMLARSVTWRGKLSPARTWSRRLTRVCWLTRLSGRILQPSAAEAGVARWIASLAGSRVSPTAPPASVSAGKTSATSGATPGGSSCSPARGPSSSRMSKACCQAAAPSGCGETWADLVSSLRSDFSARRRRARRINEQESSSLPCMRDGWPTPAARDSKGGCRKSRIERTGATVGETLDYAAEQLWATPAAMNPNDGEAPETWNARSAQLKVKHRNGNGAGKPLAIQAQELWQTPAPADVTGGRKTRSGARGDEPLLNGQALACARRVRQTATDGAASSTPRRCLNPLFVEWLMAWPPGWTLIASTGFGCSATAFIRWRRLMRSELLALGLPPAASPAQPSFL